MRLWIGPLVKSMLNHWRRVTHICISKLTIIGSDNCLLPARRQAIIWTNAGILLIGPLGTNFSKISIKIHTFSFKKMHLKMLSARWRPFCLSLNMLSFHIHHRPSFLASSTFLLQRPDDSRHVEGAGGCHRSPNPRTVRLRLWCEHRVAHCRHGVHIPCLPGWVWAYLQGVQHWRIPAEPAAGHGKTVPKSFLLWFVTLGKHPQVSWQQTYLYRADSRFVPRQWDTALLRNDISHWLGASLESALLYHWLSGRLGYLHCCSPECSGFNIRMVKTLMLKKIWPPFLQSGFSI